MIQRYKLTTQITPTLKGDYDVVAIAVPDDQGGFVMYDAVSHLIEEKTIEEQEPDQALLISMACCLNHGFGLLDKEAQDSMLHDMEKLYNEVVGVGYYSQENRERYLNMLAAAKVGEVVK